MSEETVEQTEVVEQPTQVNYEVAESEEETQGEWLKFGILAVILLVTVVIIALLRPTIFGRIVPAVLGEGQPAAPLVNSEAEGETIKPDIEEDAADEEAETTEEDESTAEETVDPTEPEKPEDFPTAVPAQTHTVRAGETLTAIAQRYDVTVQAIVAANNITNPDRVTVGTVLIIPVGQ